VLPHKEVICIAIEPDGDKWVGTCDGLVKISETEWKVYKSSNSGLRNDVVKDIAIDKDGTKWISTLSGLAKFDEPR
jgi:ligand-binding sensor domain-containing protein